MNILEYAIAKKMFGGGSGAKAYHLSSVDELPTKADDGSLALVTWVGTHWMLNDEITPSADSTSLNMRFVCDGEEWVNINYGNLGPPVSGFKFGSHDVYAEKAIGGFVAGWQDEKYRSILVLTADETAQAWLEANGTIIGESYTTLYSRENGEWVNKGEI